MSEPPRRSVRWLAALGAGWVALAGALAVVLSVGLAGRGGFGWHLALHAALFVPLAAVIVGLLRGRLRTSRSALAVVLVAAALGRLLLLPVPPVLSGDLYRAAWEGQVVLAGHDPWAEPPDAPALAGVRAAHPELRERVEYWKLPAIYPPLMQLVAAGAGALSPEPVLLKAVFVLAEALLVVALLGLARRRGLDPLWVVAYAWNPLALTEIAGSGHGDSVGIALLAFGVLAIEKGRPVGAAALAALSGMVKFAGFVLLPFALRAATEAKQKLRTVAAAAVATALPLLPFLTPERLAAGVVQRAQEFGFSLQHYARHWRFNDSLFAPLEAVFGGAARPVVLGLLLLLGLGLGLGLIGRRLPPALAVGTLAAAAFLLTPVAHPWYFLWALPFLALHPERRGLFAAALTMSLTVALSYHAFWNTPAGADWSLPLGVRLAEFGLPAVAFLAVRSKR